MIGSKKLTIIKHGLYYVPIASTLTFLLLSEEISMKFWIMEKKRVGRTEKGERRRGFGKPWRSVALEI